jgi:heptosyltransferase-2
MYRILVIAPSWIGDAMLTQPMLARLKQHYPDGDIDIFASPWTEALYRHMAEVNEVIVNPFAHGALRLGERMRIGKQLRARDYDQAIILPNSFKSALVPFFARIPVRTGYRAELRGMLLTDTRALNKRELPLMVERYAQLAEQAGFPPNRPVPPPRLPVTDQQKQRPLLRLNLSLKKPAAILCPGAEYGPSKRWLPPYFAEIAQRLQALGYNVWLIGSSRDYEVAQKIVALGNPEARNLCGETDLNDAIALLASAALVVSNDSGLMHLAAALNRPMVALFGSSSPRFTPPLSANARVMQLDLRCIPCFKRVCPLGHFDCMTKLTPDRVWQQVKQFA